MHPVRASPKLSPIEVFTVPDQDAVIMCAAALQERCLSNKKLEDAHRSRYHSSRIPTIALFDYLRRIFKYSQCSPECLFIALMYLDRYFAASRVPLTFRNVHRLVITAILVAAKIRDDIYYSNAYYASIGGVSKLEINELEMDFVKTLRWETWIEPSEFTAYVRGIVGRFGTLAAGETDTSAKATPVIKMA